MKSFICALATLGCLATATPVFAQFAKADDAIKYRQSIFFVMGQHFGRVGAMVNGRVAFDAKAAADNAELVAELAKLPWPAFGPATDKGNSKAKAEIWTESAKYKDSADKLMAESVKLSAAAKTGNLEALKTAFAATASSCKACHDSFRSQ